jgi:hypothetical protein
MQRAVVSVVREQHQQVVREMAVFHEASVARAVGDMQEETVTKAACAQAA